MKNGRSTSTTPYTVNSIHDSDSAGSFFTSGAYQASLWDIAPEFFTAGENFLFDYMFGTMENVKFRSEKALNSNNLIKVILEYDSGKEYIKTMTLRVKCRKR